MAKNYGAIRGLARFEGSTDAVFAIALTLLIVEIKPPGSLDGPHGRLIPSGSPPTHLSSTSRPGTTSSGRLTNEGA